jgi:SAM-dependent methyltransferase
MTARCTVCDGVALRRSLELGRQPPSNRFLLPGDGAEERYALSLGSCDDCGTVQLVDRMPVEAIRPRFDWLANNEPEGHLDDLVDKLMAVPGIGAASRVLGVSYKDRSTLERLSRKGISQVDCVGPEDLPDLPSPFGLECIQRSLSQPAVVEALRARHGAIDVLVVRHMVEHAESSARFLESLRGLLAPGGIMVIEFPDNDRILRGPYHAFVWEEHFSYFTEDSFRALASRAGADCLRLERYRYPLEDALVAVLRFGSPDRAGGIGTRRADPPDLEAFTRAFREQQAAWRERLARLRAAGEKLAIFGAGHLSVKWINFLGLAEFIDCVIDDHPKKAGLRMPGSRLSIVPSTELAARGIGTCITTLSPESEARVRGKMADYFTRGGRFLPAFQAA